LSSDSFSSNNGSRPRTKQVTIQRIVVVGYILALGMPPLGFVIALVLIFSPSVRSRHGPWILLISIVAAVVWALLISAGALDATNQGY
jgi:ABC-type nitrate/sulfonate/bicarbonate transport system permease component